MFTVPLYPLSDAAVTLVVPVCPAGIVNLDGEADSEKSGDVAGAKFVVSGVPRPVARS
jgi:hypothetical protein